MKRKPPKAPPQPTDAQIRHFAIRHGLTPREPMTSLRALVKDARALKGRR